MRADKDTTNSARVLNFPQKINRPLDFDEGDEVVVEVSVRISQRHQCSDGLFFICKGKGDEVIGVFASQIKRMA